MGGKGRRSLRRHGVCERGCIRQEEVLRAHVCDLSPSLLIACNHEEIDVMTERQAPTLTVWHEGTPVFTSNGNWLYPLFELEAYLADHPIQPAKLLLQDKSIGKAAALMIHRLGFRTVKAGVLSRLGEAVWQRYGIAYTYEHLVDHIGRSYVLGDGWSCT